MSNGKPLSDPKSREPITHDTVLVVEGRDMFGFFLALLEELGLQNQIEIRNAGGVNDLPAYLRVLPAISGFDAVVSLGLVRDSETDPNRAFQDLCKALRQAGLPVPAAPLQATATPPLPRVTITLLPDPNTPGMLETLCWQSLMGDPRITCIDDFLKCVEDQTGSPVAEMEKSRIHAYIAAREKPWFLLGQAARAGYFPWTSGVFDDIKSFVQGLIGSTP